MKILLFLMFTCNHFTAPNAAPTHQQNHETLDLKTVKVCFTLLSREVVCLKIVVQGIMPNQDEFNVESSIDQRSNVLTLNFGEQLNASFKVSETVNLKLGDGTKTIRKGTEVKISEGIALIQL